MKSAEVLGRVVGTQGMEVKAVVDAAVEHCHHGVLVHQRGFRFTEPQVQILPPQPIKKAALAKGRIFAHF
jgi:hypothetical protein